jgi:hypothetical protein
MIIVAVAAAGLGLSGAAAYAVGEVATAPCTTGSASLCTATESQQLGAALDSLADRYYKKGRADQAAVPTSTVTVTVTATPTATSTPAPTLTSTATTSSFVLGTTKPDATNTGIPAGTVLKPVSGDLIITTDGASVDSLDIAGHLIIKANNVKVTRTRVRGWADGAFHTYGLISCEAGKTGITIDRSELAPTTPTWWLVGIKGTGFTATRNNIHDTVDGILIYGATPAVAEGNYVHDLSFFNNSTDQATDPYHPYWTHNDAVQITGGSGHRVVGNTLRGWASPNSGTPATLINNGFPYRERPVPVTISPYKSPSTGLVIERNWLEGGEAAFQMNELNSGTNQNVGSVAGNRVDYGQHRWASGGWYAIRYAKGLTISGLTTNTWDPNAANVPLDLRGKQLQVGDKLGIWVNS